MFSKLERCRALLQAAEKIASVLLRRASTPWTSRKRQDVFGLGMPYPRVIPHSDGAGSVDQFGEGVASEWMGWEVWCYGAQSYRLFGTAAEFTVVPWIRLLRYPRTCQWNRAHV